jgi:hypothetical protein
VDVYIHSPIRLHGVVLSTGTASSLGATCYAYLILLCSITLIRLTVKCTNHEAVLSKIFPKPRFSSSVVALNSICTSESCPQMSLPYFIPYGDRLNFAPILIKLLSESLFRYLAQGREGNTYYVGSLRKSSDCD